MSGLDLTSREADWIAAVAQTEVPQSIARNNPDVYAAMVNGVVDTILNRVVSPRFPDTVEGVLNQSRQFTKITGPSSRNPYGSVQNTPAAPQSTRAAVQSHLEARAGGAPSSIGGNLHYANPNHSDQSNLIGWINPMIEAGATPLGVGDAVHYHGTDPTGNFSPIEAQLAGLEGFTAQQGPPIPADYVGPQYANVASPTPAPAPQPVGDMIASAFGPSVPPNAPSQIAALPAVPAQGYGGRGELSPQQVGSQQGGASSGSFERVPSFDLFGSSHRVEAERLARSVTAQAGPSPAGPAFPVTPASNYAPPTYGGRGELSPQQVAQQQNPSTAGDSSGGGFWSSFADLFGGQTSNPNPAPQASARQETTPRLSEAFDTRWETRSVPNPNFNPIPQGLAEQYAMRALGGSQSRPMGPNGVGLGPAAQPPTILERVPIRVPINLAPAPPVNLAPAPQAPQNNQNVNNPSWSHPVFGYSRSVAAEGGSGGSAFGAFYDSQYGPSGSGWGGGGGSSGGGGCFITTAVCDWLGRPDDCEELEVLRAFRDGYMMADPDREAQIKEYYEIAPQLVERVNAMANSDDVWLTVYGAFLVPAVKCIQAAHWAEAHEIYTDLVFWLKGATELHAPDS